MVDLPSEFHRAFHLSYDDLPSNLKQCFLFCSLYPEDFMFEKTKLVYLWLAEGFLRDEGSLSFVELGKDYYNELISRNFLEVSPEYYDKKRCKMHDLLRSFAGYLTKGENSIISKNVLSRKSESFLKLRRLSIEGTTKDLEFCKKEKYLRTLLLIDNRMGDVLQDMLLLFSQLRTLDLANSNITRLSDSFCGLEHLRFLNLSQSKLQSLPNSIGNLRRLVYLNLNNCEQLSHVPSSIFDLLDLGYLSIYNTKVMLFPLGLRKLEKLIQFHGFKPYKNSSNSFSSLEDLGTMYQISELSLYSLDKALDVTAAKKANLQDKVHLFRLRFSYTPNQGSQVPTIEEKNVVEDVLNELRPPPSLKILTINGYYGHQLPNWLHVGTDPSNLKFLRYLELTNCECFRQLSSLGQLSNLDLLRIKGAISITKIGREFLLDDGKDHIRTEVTHSSIVPFAQLNKLYFMRMSNWVEWLWEEDQPAMPKLKKLFIEDCPKLSSLPKGLLHHATSLELLQIGNCETIKYVENLQSVKDLRIFNNSNLYKISNIPNISFIRISECPNLKILENLKRFHRMELSDILMETLPEYLITTMPEKLTVWCKNELLVKITCQGIGGSEWKKFEHIHVVKVYSNDQSLYAEYRKSPFSFTTNVDQQKQSNSISSEDEESAG
ncbi:Disease resistance protein (CC-NBS-LRR class) family [Rhynchospora pubera]|uniref:Disease resistance protein (CC-NBS-LRR class) family n=1 Tax=Rhynchospora pubera TaxID=906938 RepID=A0AAV8DYI4_9POAL|nr:Disease resistance protein (CC-NBS-LRR class) family [Rhynchospora pubera]